jgi:uncharacterized protein (DUF362 family)
MLRREFCAKLLQAGGAVALVPLLQACAPAAPEDPTELSTAGAEATPTTTPTTTGPAQTATATPASTATPTPTALSTAAVPTSSPTVIPTGKSGARVALVKTTDRVTGARQAIELLGINPAAGNRVLLKPNYNSADPAPGSTETAMLRELVAVLEEMGAGKLTVADRSGMGNTTAVMQAKGLPELAEELGFDLVALDTLTEADYTLITDAAFHWPHGFAMPKMVLEAECIIQACCLKTHRYGGHFTMSLKNSVGLVPGTPSGSGFVGSHNYMRDLHNSPHQRLMIAEINAAYTPALIVMDGVEAFVQGGPATGTRAPTEVMLASADRVAIDAVGVALLRMFGTTPEVSRGRVFEQEQIARAVELGLGVDAPEKITFVTGDAESEAYAEEIRQTLIA